MLINDCILSFNLLFTYMQVTPNLEAKKYWLSFNNLWIFDSIKWSKSNELNSILIRLGEYFEKLKLDIALKSCPSASIFK